MLSLENLGQTNSYSFAQCTKDSGNGCLSPVLSKDLQPQFSRSTARLRVQPGAQLSSARSRGHRGCFISFCFFPAGSQVKTKQTKPQTNKHRPRPQQLKKTPKPPQNTHTKLQMLKNCTKKSQQKASLNTSSPIGCLESSRFEEKRWVTSPSIYI